VASLEQFTVDRIVAPGDTLDERAARRSLRQQVARLERELSHVVAAAFPHVPASAARVGDHGAGGPRLLGLAQLERERDALAGRLQDVRRLVRARVEHERRAHELLERMKLEPGRYRFVRLPVRDLGEGGCGVWEVRPRLGLIGMLAGWWQLTLSSGCATLAVGHRPDGLLLGHRDLGEELAAAGLAPASLTHQQVGDGHALRLPRAGEDHLGGIDLIHRDTALELGSREANLVRALECTHVLRSRGNCRCRVHVDSPTLRAPGQRKTATSILGFNEIALLMASETTVGRADANPRRLNLR